MEHTSRHSLELLHLTSSLAFTRNSWLSSGANSLTIASGFSQAMQPTIVMACGLPLSEYFFHITNSLYEVCMFSAEGDTGGRDQNAMELATEMRYRKQSHCSGSSLHQSCLFAVCMCTFMSYLVHMSQVLCQRRHVQCQHVGWGTLWM